MASPKLSRRIFMSEADNYKDFIGKSPKWNSYVTFSSGLAPTGAHLCAGDVDSPCLLHSVFVRDPQPLIGAENVQGNAWSVDDHDWNWCDLIGSLRSRAQQ